jgi:oligogalacturonide lyase
MSAGRVWAAEGREFEDKKTGAHVRQLTDYRAHSHHLYFTNPGWYDDGGKLVFGGDRENHTHLFCIDLASGEITQLTDLERNANFQTVTVNPARAEAYFWYGRALTGIDLHTLELRTLWERPDGFFPSSINCTADGEHVCGSIFEDLSKRMDIDYGHGYVGFRETSEAKPFSRLFRVPTDGGDCETVWEEQYWIGHCNTSPTQANLLTFCHEGPWAIVDNRIWGFDLSTGKAWKIRERKHPDEIVGHEYWFADGVRIGYHGTTADKQPCFGRIRCDDTENVEGVSAGETGHIHSNDHTLIVGDGGAGSPGIKLWKWNGESYDGPRLLTSTRSSFHIQWLHPHPRFSPDGTQVLYTDDANGYGNLFLANVPDFESLTQTD